MGFTDSWAAKLGFHRHLGRQIGVSPTVGPDFAASRPGPKRDFPETTPQGQGKNTETHLTRLMTPKGVRGLFPGGFSISASSEPAKYIPNERIPFIINGFRPR